jgi:hypothetical protein
MRFQSELSEKIGWGGDIELSYTIGPMYRGQNIVQIMISLYLIERKGSFLCGVKEENVSSIKIIEKLGFKLYITKKKLIFIS